MERTLAKCCVLVLLMMVLGRTTSSSRAESIPWKYNWSRSRAIIPADAPSTGYITLTDGPLKGASGSSDIVATNLRIHSSASPSNPDTFTNAAYSLTLFLLDETSGESGFLTYGAEFNGWITSASSNLVHEFTGPTTQSIGLGTSLYTVTIGPYTPPGPPDSSNTGAVSAYAYVEVKPMEAAPEPSTLLLSSIALPFIGFAAWKKRRAKLPEVN